jgi:hypothetical protein
MSMLLAGALKVWIPQGRMQPCRVHSRIHSRPQVLDLRTHIVNLIFHRQINQLTIIHLNQVQCLTFLPVCQLQSQNHSNDR